MFRASRCQQRPSVGGAGRLGLLPKVAAVDLGWAGPTVARSRLGRPGRPCRWRLGARSARPSLRHALHCVASTGPSLPSWRRRTPESVERRQVRWAALATHGRGQRTCRRGCRNSSLVSSVIAAALVQVGLLDQGLQAPRPPSCADAKPSHVSVRDGRRFWGFLDAASGQKIEVEVPQESLGRLRAPGNRCARSRSPRSPQTVDAEGKRSPSSPLPGAH